MGLPVIDSSHNAGDQRSFGGTLGCHWIASDPLLNSQARLRDFGVVADIALLVDVGIDRA